MQSSNSNQQLPKSKPAAEVEQDMVKVFVYGTLKKGYNNHRLLAGRSIYIGENAITGKLFDLGPYPAAEKDGNDHIFGEVYLVGPHTLQDLDRLEGHPNFYRRELVKALHYGQPDVWVYFCPGYSKRGQYLPGGVWGR